MQKRKQGTDASHDDVLDPKLLKLSAQIDRQMYPDLYPKAVNKNKTVKKKINMELLSAEQSRVVEMVTVEKKSIFFTGAAGTGKSFLLKAIIQKLGEIGLSNSMVITGTTGIAACNIGGYERGGGLCSQYMLW
jgi:DNA replication protein DnaC